MNTDRREKGAERHPCKSVKSVVKFSRVTSGLMVDWEVLDHSSCRNFEIEGVALGP
jgi:hypothetical protein